MAELTPAQQATQAICRMRNIKYDVKKFDSEYSPRKRDYARVNALNQMQDREVEKRILNGEIGFSQNGESKISQGLNVILD